MKTAHVTFLCVALVIASSAICSAGNGDASAQWWGKPPGQKPVVHGHVANVSPTNIAVETRQGIKPFVVDANTKVMIRGEQSTIDDVAVGDPVVVRFKLQTDNVPLALGVLVPKPIVKGKIVSVDADLIILRDKEGEHRVVVTADTKYVCHGCQGTLDDLRVGYFACAAGASDGDKLIADRVRFMAGVAKGTVIARDSDSITVKTVKQLTIDCLASQATAVLIRPRVGPNYKGTLADVQVGSPVNIGFHPNPKGPAALLWIDVLTGQ